MPTSAASRPNRCGDASLEPRSHLPSPSTSPPSLTTAQPHLSPFPQPPPPPHPFPAPQLARPPRLPRIPTPTPILTLTLTLILPTTTTTTTTLPLPLPLPTPAPGPSAAVSLPFSVLSSLELRLLARAQTQACRGRLASHSLSAGGLRGRRPRPSGRQLASIASHRFRLRCSRLAPEART